MTPPIKPENERLIQQYSQTLAVSKRNILDFPVTVRSAQMMAIGNAKIKLVELRKELFDWLPKRLVGCFVDGAPEAVTAVAKLLRENDGVVIDGDQLMNQLVTTVQKTKTHGSIQVGIGQYSLVISELKSLCLDLEVEMSVDEFARTANCPTPESIAAWIRSIIGPQFDTLNLKFLMSQIVNHVVAMVGDGVVDFKSVPVLVQNPKPNLTSLFNRVTEQTLKPNFETNIDNVTKLFKKSNPNKKENEPNV